MKTIFTIMISGLLLSGELCAQDGNNPVNDYRVVAHKKNNTAIESVSNEVQIATPISIFIPNAFTPNEDGTNDEFGIVGEGVEEMTLYIFNRWGEVIFESNDVSKKWNGTFKGEKCENGVYVYKVVARNKMTNQFFEKTGHVTLVS
ncbi:MAG: gliding motility-associated C-terminal domain-containing protein [Bacteroidota bacterium]